MIRSLLAVLTLCLFATPALSVPVDVFSNTLLIYNNGVLEEEVWEVFFFDQDGTVTSASAQQAGNPSINMQQEGSEWFADPPFPGPVGGINTVQANSSSVTWERVTSHTGGNVPTISSAFGDGSTISVDWSCEGGCLAPVGPFSHISLNMFLFDETEDIVDLGGAIFSGAPSAFTEKTGTFVFSGTEVENIAPGDYFLEIEIFTVGGELPLSSLTMDGPLDFTVFEEASRLNTYAITVGDFGGVTIVPEPSSALMMGAGLFGLALVGSRRKR